MPVEVSSLTNDPVMQGLKMTLDVAAMKHQAIASNIANVNTPNYKRLDLTSSFKTEFKNAMNAVQAGQTLPEISKPTLGEAATAGGVRLDGNNVNMEQELMELMDNKSRFDFASKMLIQRYNLVRSAIKGSGA